MIKVENLKRQLLQALIITVVVVAALSLNNVSNYFSTLLYIFILAIIPYPIIMVIWLVLSNQTCKYFDTTGAKTYFIYLLYNSAIPILILSLLAVWDWGSRLTQDILFTNYFGGYFSDGVWAILGVLPTLVKIMIDLTSGNSSNHHINSSSETSLNESASAKTK